MTIIQEAITLLVLWLAVSVNLFIIGHISGQLFGKLLLKIYTCWTGFDVHYVDEGFINTFKGLEAWKVLTKLEELKHQAKLKESD